MNIFENATRYAAVAVEIPGKHEHVETMIQTVLHYILAETDLKVKGIHPPFECPVCGESAQEKTPIGKGIGITPGGVMLVYAVAGNPWNVMFMTKDEYEENYSNIPLESLYTHSPHIKKCIETINARKDDLEKYAKKPTKTKRTKEQRYRAMHMICNILGLEKIGDYAKINGHIVHKNDLWPATLLAVDEMVNAGKIGDAEAIEFCEDFREYIFN